ncbi:MAG: M56 family metallopeptidase [Bacteroidota bacterium]
MEVYLIKWAACLGIFYLFYRLFLEHTSAHIIKRIYLLSALAASFIIPLITFTQYVVVTETVLPTTITQLSQDSLLIQDPSEEALVNLSTVLWSIYGLGVAVFGLRFLRNLYGILRKIRSNPIVQDRNIFHVLLAASTTPHTFFSYIFLNKWKFEAREIPQEVLLHERTHAVQRHSIDVLLIELIQVFCWFNPLVYAMKHSIKLNHEFLADRAVLDAGIPTSGYQKTLLAFSSNAGAPMLANSINYSSNRLSMLFSKIAFGQVKKRFTVMKKQTSQRGIWLRTLILLPLVAILVYSFSDTRVIETKAEINSEETQKASEKEVATYNGLAKKYNEQFAMDPTTRVVKMSDLNTLEGIYKKMTPTQKAAAQPFPECIPPPPPAELKEQQKRKATLKEIKEYNKLAKKYNEMDPKNMWIDGKEITRMHYLYDLMTLDQRKKAEPFPSFPPPPPLPDPPNLAEVADLPPPPPGVAEVNEFEVAELPPPPPPPGPPSTDGANEFKLADPPPPPPMPPHAFDENSNFFFEGKSISYKKALKLIDEEGYQVQVFNADTDTPTVKISSEPFVVKKGDISSIPPPPPPPKDPKEHIREMIEKGATFYYEGEKVTANYIQDVVLFNKNLNIQTRTRGSNPPVVYISKNFVATPPDESDSNKKQN